jgi:hypothetical protein
VKSKPVEVRIFELGSAEFGDRSAAQSREFVERVRETLPDALALLREAIERVERARRAVFEHDTQARDPVCALAVDQVTDDVVRGPRVRAFVAHRPAFGQPVGL